MQMLLLMGALQFSYMGTHNVDGAKDVCIAFLCAIIAIDVLVAAAEGKFASKRD